MSRFTVLVLTAVAVLLMMLASETTASAGDPHDAPQGVWVGEMLKQAQAGYNWRVQEEQAEARCDRTGAIFYGMLAERHEAQARQLWERHGPKVRF